MPLSIRQGLRFGGQGDLGAVALPNRPNNAEFTWEALIMPAGFLPNIGNMFLTGTNAGDYMRVRADGKPDMRMSSVQLAGTYTIAVGELVHIAATCANNGPMSLYVNGVLNAESSVGNLADRINTIGKYTSADQRPFNGFISTVREYNRALSASEVAANYEGRVTRDGLVGEWLMQEGQGTTAYDTSGNGNHGTISGATWAIKKAQSVKPATKPKKNMIPPFTDSRWTLHENSRMKQANFVGKVSGSTVENPHTVKYTASQTLVAPNGVWYSELELGRYDGLSSLNGAVIAVSNKTTNGNIMQQLFSFNLIEHVLRNYGAPVFGSAVTVADRVAWIKANIAKLTCNWHGYGSGPAGNRAVLSMWEVSASSWTPTSSHLLGTISKATLSSTNPIVRIDANGFAHFIAYAEATDGVTASTISTDFVELEVYMAKGSIPQLDYEFTINATGPYQMASIYFDVLPNTTYTAQITDNADAAYMDIYKVDGTWRYTIGASSVGNAGKVIVTTPDETRLQIRLYANVAGIFTFTNPQIELGSVATDFEPYIPLPDNKPAPMKPKKNMLKVTDYAVNGGSDPTSFDLTTGLVQGGTYWLSGIFAIFPDDTTTNDRVTFQFYYADGSRDVLNNGLNSQIRDGVERFVAITGTSNPAKILTLIKILLFDYSTPGTKMHRTARQVQLEQGLLTAFEPYIPLPDIKRLPIAADSFNRADNASSLGNADTGQAWTAASGTWGIRNGEAYCASDTVSGLAWLDAGTTRFIASMDGSGQYITQWRYPTLLLHYIDAGNYIFTRLDSGNAALVKRQGGVNTVLFTGPFSLTNGQTYNHKVVADDGRFDFYVDGGLRGSYTLTPAESNLFLQSTKVGIRLTVSGTPTFNADFDNFRIERL